jgi:hypothetical protein
LDRPVLGPATGSFPELSAIAGAEWVQTYAGEFDQRVLRHALEVLLPEGRPHLDGLEWGLLSRRTLCAYRSARNSRRDVAGLMRRLRVARAR